MHTSAELKEHGEDPGSPAQTWKPLRFLNYYRIVLASLFTMLFFADASPRFLGKHQPELFGAVAAAYLAFSLLCSFTIHARRPRFEFQANLQILTDITAITLLMHASAGLTSGLGILLVVAIAGGSAIMAGRLALLYAATATLAILVEQVYADLTMAFPTTAYTHAGLLGTAFFATALLSNVLGRRARESEALARQRGIDLADMEQLNDYIIQNMQSGILVVDADNRVRMINESGWYLLGRPVIGDKPKLAQLSPSLAQQLEAWQQDAENSPSSFQSTDDAPVVLPRFMPLGVKAGGETLILLEDSTEVIQQMQQIKLASLGRLTASIAHEIRNPLGAISHAAQLLQESPNLDGNDARLTEIVRNHTARVNTIVENVLQVSRRGQSHPREFELGPWIQDFTTEFSAVLDLSAERLTTEISPPTARVFMDPNHLHQVLWNLCQNALQHGRETARLLLRGGHGQDARRPYLDVIDNGPGIDPETAQQIFDPFFTTSNSGTGLGLYIARELCECNRARLSYVPVPTGGSCFRISFSDPSRLQL